MDTTIDYTTTIGIATADDVNMSFVMYDTFSNFCFLRQKIDFGAYGF